MERVIPFIPYLPSAQWYAEWLFLQSEGMPEEQAANEASRLLSLRPKDFAHTAIAGSNPVGLLLAIPVAGGGKVLKHRLPDNLEISLHGNWPHMHLKAFEASYGRTPFYQHIIQAIGPFYQEIPRLMADFNHSLHKEITGIIGADKISDYLSALSSSQKRIVAERGKELLAATDFSLSIIDLAMRLGKESVLPLLAAKMIRNS